jgi:hypothetical protein
VTVYVDRPTVPADEPVDSPTIDVPMPTSSFPVITSPREGSLITPINDTVWFIGTGPATLTVVLTTANGALIGATTSDSQGNWRILAASGRFQGSQQNVQATIVTDGSASSLVSFTFKKATLMERILRVVGAVGLDHAISSRP